VLGLVAFGEVASMMYESVAGKSWWPGDYGDEWGTSGMRSLDDRPGVIAGGSKENGTCRWTGWGG